GLAAQHLDCFERVHRPTDHRRPGMAPAIRAMAERVHHRVAVHFIADRAAMTAANHRHGSLLSRSGRCRESRCRIGVSGGVLLRRVAGRATAPRRGPQAARRTALSTSVLPSDQIAPGTLWLPAMTSSNAFSIQLQSSSVMVSGGRSLMVWLPWPATCVRIL